ncbi:hypothetical protein [Halovivax asiaticus]|nr:hypothetical protein [Halovivax asiaticus]
MADETRLESARADTRSCPGIGLLVAGSLLILVSIVFFDETSGTSWVWAGTVTVVILSLVALAFVCRSSSR